MLIWTFVFFCQNIDFSAKWLVVLKIEQSLQLQLGLVNYKKKAFRLLKL